MAPHIMKPEMGPVCRERLHSGRWRSSGLRRTGVRPSLAYRQNLFCLLKRTECHSTLQSTLSRHQSSPALRFRGISGSLTRGTRDVSHATRKRFSMVLCDTAGTTCARISFLFAVTAVRTMRRSWRASVLRGRPEPGLRVRECSSDHCWKQRHTTDTLCQTCASIRRYVHPASRRPTIRPVQMAKLRLQLHDTSYNLSPYDIRHLYDRFHIENICLCCFLRG